MSRQLTTIPLSLFRLCWQNAPPPLCNTPQFSESFAHNGESFFEKDSRVWLRERAYTQEKKSRFLDLHQYESNEDLSCTFSKNESNLRRGVQEHSQCFLFQT